MIALLACTAAVLAASLLIGRAILLLLRWPSPHWLAGATGFAALVVVAPFLVRLPGRGNTAAVLLLLATALAAWFCWVRRTRDAGVGEASPDAPAARTRGLSGEVSPAPAGGYRANLLLGGTVVLATLLLASLPFLFNERVGVLGEGIYTNDHAAQLFWADWLQRGFGPQPSAVQFGYPVGPQAVAAAVGELPGVDLIDAFNGLLLAIPALTALAALSMLGGLVPRRRVFAAVLVGLPYLAASFLAQSAFKETAMAMFLLAFACGLQGVPGGGVSLWRQTAPLALLLAAASVLTFSLPGLVWFVIAVPVWLAFGVASGRSPVDFRALGESLRRHRAVLAGAALVLVAAAVLLFGPASNFVEKIGDVQESAGRLSSPVFPGEALGIWPQGDFRIVRGEVSGSLLATAAGALALLGGILVLIRRRDWALFAGLVAAGAVYVASRPIAEIHVEAKALAIMAPLVTLVALRALLAPPYAGEVAPGAGTTAQSGPLFRPEPRAVALVRQAFGALVALAMLASTLLALGAAPVGFDERQRGLEELAERVEGESVAFLGVDRFAGYYLRDTLMRAPAGYVPNEIAARPEKVWDQGEPADFDTLDSGKLDKFDYAIAPDVAYASAPPTNFGRVAEAGDYVLWERQGETPRSRVLDEGGAPGVQRPECALDPGESPGGRRARASVFLFAPTVDGLGGWIGAGPAEDAAGGQERGFLAPDTATQRLGLPEPHSYELSLQYHSQVPLEVLVDGEPLAELPPSLEGMYLDGAGQGAFWPAGSFETEGEPDVEVQVRAAEPSGLQDALGIERRVWLGELAATAVSDPVERTTQIECGAYVDHFRYPRGGE